jgi:phage shock protein PspC (stress-responsive transcriptional regulator)
MAGRPVTGKAEVMNTTEKITEAGGAAARPDDSGPALYRPNHDRMLAGVASGIARYLAVDVLLVRIALVALIIVGGIGLPLYLACWLLIPDEGASQSIAANFVQSLRAGGQL